MALILICDRCEKIIKKPFGMHEDTEPDDIVFCDRCDKEFRLFLKSKDKTLYTDLYSKIEYGITKDLINGGS